MILRWKRSNYKVLAVRSPGRNVYHFQCLSIETKEPKTLHFLIEGFLEAANAADKAMKKPKDILLLDMDNQGKAAVLTEKQINRLSRVWVQMSGVHNRMKKCGLRKSRNLVHPIQESLKIP